MADPAGHPMRLLKIIALVFGVGAVFACETNDGVPDFTTSESGVIDAELFTNVFFVQPKFNGQAGPHLGVDTGAPLIIVDHATLPEGSSPGPNVSYGQLETFELGALRAENVSVLTDRTLSRELEEINIGGLLGCTVLCSLESTYDYAGWQLSLGPRERPEGIGAAITIELSGQGGGRFMFPSLDEIIDVRASRLLVDATVEGITGRFLFDTGASATVLRPAFAERLRDGRPELPIPVSGMFGMTTATMFRVGALSVDDASVSGTIVAVSPDLDALMDAVEAETNETLDGVLGGTFLNHHYVEVDYPGREVRLFPYESKARVRDEVARVGIQTELDLSPGEGQVDGGLRVTAVAPDSSTEQSGVVVGDFIVEVDGLELDGLPARRAVDALTGPPGIEKQVSFGCPRSDLGCVGAFRGERTLVVDQDPLARP